MDRRNLRSEVSTHSHIALLEVFVSLAVQRIESRVFSNSLSVKVGGFDCPLRECTQLPEAMLTEYFCELFDLTSLLRA